jgi:DNA-binding transcriptional regulator LsrR (DeoR family)
MSRKSDTEANRLDDAARAGWLYYIAGNTQDEIAGKLGVSRQTAQRLVSLAVSERLIKVRLDHPIAQCLDLARRLTDRFALRLCEVVPADPSSQSTTLGVAEATAAELERRLEAPHPIIIAMGSGRTLRAAVEQLPPMDCPQHKIVSLVGNIARDGSASFYDVIMRIADAVKAPHYPMPLTVIAATTQERQVFVTQKSVAIVLDLALRADVTFVGVGHIGEDGPMLKDGFVTAAEMHALVRAGAVGEIVGWAFDAGGTLIEAVHNDRVTSAPLQRPPGRLVVAAAMGSRKAGAILAALRGGLINGLITNEATAGLLLSP